MTDMIETWIQLTLESLGYPVSQSPGDASAETWLSWNTVGGQFNACGNTSTRLRHSFQLHAWTHGQNGEHRAAFFAAIQALKAAGARVYSYGPDQFEQDTRISHIACTCTWSQAIR